VRMFVIIGLLLAATAAQAENDDKTQRQICQGKLITVHEVHFRVGKCEFTEGLPAGSAVLRACDNERGRKRGCVVETDANNEHVYSARVR
jgi:hypothetical protein